jgi:hypothetical protein
MEKLIDPDTLLFNWTAEVKLNNNQIITIWYTAWPSTKNTVKEILSISSDYPKRLINNSLTLKPAS